MKNSSLKSIFFAAFIKFQLFPAIYSSDFSQNEILKYRNEVKQMFYHAYNGYMKYAYPYDELRPITCDGHDTWGSYSLTLIDALDTLAVVGNSSEFNRVVNLISQRKDFNEDINVSVFETNIRIIGGLLSGHLLYQKMNVPLPKGWPCNGPLLKLAKDAAYRLLPAFDTPTGMPYGTVNLRYGVPEGETPVTCAAGVGTFIIEFGTLSRLTNQPIFEQVALRSLNKLWELRSQIGLIGNHIDVVTGLWTAQDSGIGAGVDSFFEYLVKGSFHLQRPELLHIFNEARVPIEDFLRHEDWYLWATMSKGHVTMAIFQSLEAFWPGVLTLVGDVENATKIILNYHQVWKQLGFTPEFYNIPQRVTQNKREGYPLRPEFAESLVYLYQATKDHTYLKMGADIISSIEYSSKTKCGYATIKNVNDHSLTNRMESFFLAETTKYLYLLFTDDHWIHNKGNRGHILQVGKHHCVLGASYFFNTEAHPMDTGALDCCLSPRYHSAFKLPTDKVKTTPSDAAKTPTAPDVSYIINELKKRQMNTQDNVINSSEENLVNLTLPKEILDKNADKDHAKADPKESNMPVEVLYKPQKEEREDDNIHMTNNNNDKQDDTDNNKEIEYSPNDKQTTDANRFKFSTFVVKSTTPSELTSSREKNIENKMVPPTKKEKRDFSIDNLKKKLENEMFIYTYKWRNVPYSVLQCPNLPFTFLLNKKGQVFR